MIDAPPSLVKRLRVLIIRYLLLSWATDFLFDPDPVVGGEDDVNAAMQAGDITIAWPV